MSIKAWPFLISRNRVFDYRPIVVPQPLIEKEASTLLVEIAGGSLSAPNTATYREVRSSLIGNMGFVFRVVRAEQGHVGLSGSDPLRDEVGRPINLIEGLVLEGITRGVVITKEDFRAAHEAIEAAYREFWQDTKHTPAMKPSHYFYLSGQNRAGECVILKEEPPLDMRTQETTGNDLSFLERIYELLQRIFQKS